MAVALSAAQAGRALLAQPAMTSHPAARTLGFVALITWLLDAGSGGYMLTTWIRRGGLGRVRAAGEGLAPVLVFSHFGLASGGLLLWISYLVTGVTALAWVAVTLLVLVIGLGISTVTLWTPFPSAPAEDPASLPGERLAGPGELSLTGALTDDTLARALTDDALLQRLIEEVVASVPADPTRPAKPARKPRQHIAALIPAGHGIAALATVVLAVLAAVAAL
jgi:hypothetical protein